MILNCPACATRYRVAEAEFDEPGGRTVRCGNCGHVWRETPKTEGPRPPADRNHLSKTAPTPDSTLNQPTLGAAPQLNPRPEVKPLAASPKGRRGAAARWIVALIILLVALTAAGVLARHQIATVWPTMARLNASVGQTGAELIIRKITPSRTADGLMIDGEIANLGTVSRDVPRLRIALRDTADREIQYEIVDPPKTQLQPSEVVHFTKPFAHPPNNAAGVVVTFASP